MTYTVTVQPLFEMKVDRHLLEKSAGFVVDFEREMEKRLLEYMGSDPEAMAELTYDPLNLSYAFRVTELAQRG